MAEDKPLSEGTGSTEEPRRSDEDGILAALSALSNAAAPVRDNESTDDAAVTTTVVDVIATTPDAANERSAAEESEMPDESDGSSSIVEEAPAPPPAPESVDTYPAPVGTPVAVSASIPAPDSAPATTKRKKWPWILALCIVAGLVALGGMVSCTFHMLGTAFHAIQHNERYFDYEELFNHDAQDGLWNYYYGGMDVTFDDLLTIFNVEEGVITPNGKYALGAYRVGSENGIVPDLYYLEGAQTGVSNFYVFHPDGDSDEVRYEIALSAEYFGNYYTQLEEGDAIIFAPFDANSLMYVASDQPMDILLPYESGCYRVGVDIPAGTYTITCNTEESRLTDSEAGAYVMSDLAFDEDSITESVYVIKGGRQTITVDNGEYLELFAAIATPATASNKVPLQHVESESNYAA